MNELTTDLKSLHEATLNNLKSSKANNTLRACASLFANTMKNVHLNKSIHSNFIN